jgi:DNA-binding NtrC family response regulator
MHRRRAISTDSGSLRTQLPSPCPSAALGTQIARFAIGSVCSAEGVEPARPGWKMRQAHSLWIVHREHGVRAALARLASASEDTVTGAPNEPLFDSAGAPDTVLLGLAGDLERELEFAQRMSRKLQRSGWVVLGAASELERARSLFDTVPAEFLSYPPPAGELRQAIEEAPRPASRPLPLSKRPGRERARDRVSLGLADLELPDLLRALDPRLADVPVLILGEHGTRRGTLARYIHEFGAAAGGAFVEIYCTESSSPRELLEQIAAAVPSPRGESVCTLWLGEAGRLRPAVQRRVHGWIEYGLPRGALRCACVRWIGTAQEHQLVPELRRSLAGLTLRLPPLRERPESIANLASSMAHAWSEVRGMHPRRLAEDALSVLEEYPWPGNLWELEATVTQSLAGSAADPLGRADLVLDGAPFAPLEVVTPTDEEAAELEAQPASDQGAALESIPVASSFEEALEEIQASLAEEAPAAEALEGFEPPAAPAAEAQSAELPVASAASRQPLWSEEFKRLAAALGHELRNPLTTVRTFTELLPKRFDDPEFRRRFSELAGRSLHQLEEVLSRVEQLAALPRPDRLPVDVCGLLEEVLRERRPRIHEKRVLVLEELDRDRPCALGDPSQLRFAFELIVDEALALLSQRGDLYVAARQGAGEGQGGPGVRVLVRFRSRNNGPQVVGGADLSPAANALALAVAELVVQAQGGSFTLDTRDRHETLIVLDLPG